MYIHSLFCPFVLQIEFPKESNNVRMREQIFLVIVSLSHSLVHAYTLSPQQDATEIFVHSFVIILGYHYSGHTSDTDVDKLEVTKCKLIEQRV